MYIFQIIIGSSKTYCINTNLIFNDAEKCIIIYFIRLLV